MTVYILVLAAIITGCIVALVNLARADSYAKHTQEFRTREQRLHHDLRWVEVFAEPDERPVVRHLLAADRARIEGVTDL